METELFVHFAEIAGVFVGFGALISLRSARLDVHDVLYLQAVLMLGVWVVIASLVPIAVSRYDVRDHTLWLWSALVALAVWVTVLIAYWRGPESRQLESQDLEPMERLFPLVGLPLHLVIAVSLILVIVGVWRRVDEALYVTALAAGVVFAGYTLLMCVMSQTHEGGPDRDSRRSEPE